MSASSSTTEGQQVFGDIVVIVIGEILRINEKFRLLAKNKDPKQGPVQNEMIEITGPMRIAQNDKEPNNYEVTNCYVNRMGRFAILEPQDHKYYIYQIDIAQGIATNIGIAPISGTGVKEMFFPVYDGPSNSEAASIGTEWHAVFESVVRAAIGSDNPASAIEKHTPNEGNFTLCFPKKVIHAANNAQGLGPILFKYREKVGAFKNTISKVFLSAGWNPAQSEISILTSKTPDETSTCAYPVDIAGSIDAIFKRKNPLSGVEEYMVVDWKTTKLPVTNVDSRDGRTWAFPPISHLPNCRLSQYSVQLHLYAHILKHEYGLNVTRMVAVCFDIDKTKFDIQEISYSDKMIKSILGSFNEFVIKHNTRREAAQ